MGPKLSVLSEIVITCWMHVTGSRRGGRIGQPTHRTMLFHENGSEWCCTSTVKYVNSNWSPIHFVIEKCNAPIHVWVEKTTQHKIPQQWNPVTFWRHYMFACSEPKSCFASFFRLLLIYDARTFLCWCGNVRILWKYDNHSYLPKTSWNWIKPTHLQTQQKHFILCYGRC